MVSFTEKSCFIVRLMSSDLFDCTLIGGVHAAQSHNGCGGAEDHRLTMYPFQIESMGHGGGRLRLGSVRRLLAKIETPDIPTEGADGTQTLMKMMIDA